MARNPIVGSTVRFTFEDGPMLGKTFEHTFDPNGMVTWRMLDTSSQGKPSPPAKYEFETVGEHVYAVSYLSESGYTLTVVLDDRTRRLVAFSSNEKSVSVQHGSFDRDADEAQAPRRADTGSAKRQSGERVPLAKNQA
jgi:MoaF N-terminal domain